MAHIGCYLTPYMPYALAHIWVLFDPHKQFLAHIACYLIHTSSTGPQTVLDHIDTRSQIWAPRNTEKPTAKIRSPAVCKINSLHHCQTNISSRIPLHPLKAMLRATCSKPPIKKREFFFATPQALRHTVGWARWGSLFCKAGILVAPNFALRG